jgi:hypothetical protein
VRLAAASISFVGGHRNDSRFAANGAGYGVGVSDHTTPPDPTPEPDMAPGDEAPPRTEAAGADVCPECNGSGKLDGQECPACEGTGNVMRGIGGG